jgi:biotin-dependent carboxylase-like uncharacterized protein
MIEILNGGIGSTIQDIGRFGYYNLGISWSGPMDVFSFKIGNLLVGNEISEACIEVTVGLEIRALESCTIAITGGDLSPTVNGRKVEMWSTLEIEKNDIISFNSVISGCWAYLCVAGGIDVPLLFGSKSTHLLGRRGDQGFGGYEGRVLRRNDILKVGEKKISGTVARKRKLKQHLIPKYSPPWEVRVVMGPYDSMYTAESIERFLTYPWKVSRLVGRTGYRYEGPPLEFRPRPEYQLKAAGGDASNTVTDGIPLGAVQTPRGFPVVFLAGGATVGGYAKIATVITADLSKVGQSKPREITYFRQVTLDEAYQALEELNNLADEKNLTG